jgi:hypothetical protein
MTRKILFAFFLLTSMSLSAQKQEFIGVGINSEMKNGENMRTGVAFSYENQLTKHHGFEIELNQRFADRYITGPVGDGTFQTSHIIENYLSLPILYKFYSNIVNLSTGLNIDYFVGWNDVTKFGVTEPNSYNINPKLYIGWVFKVGKTIPLSSKFILEPEIHFNPIFQYGYSYYGVAMKLKYKL